MKILVICMKWYPIRSNLVPGGAEMVERQQIKLLSKDHEVFYTCSSDSEPLPERARPVILSHKAYNSYNPPLDKAAKSAMSRKRNEEICKAIKHIKPDAIIVHDESSGIHLKIVSDFPHIPTLVFIHNLPNLVPGIMIFSRFKAFDAMIKCGNLIVFGTDFCRDQWMAQFGKSEKFFSKQGLGHLRLQDFMNGSEVCRFWVNEREDITVENDGGYFLTVSRLDPMKRLPLIYGVFMDTEHTLCCCSTYPVQKSEMDVWFRLESIRTTNISHLLDVDRGAVLGLIKHAKYVVTAGDESTGLVALEANSFGVPVLNFAPRGRSSVTEIATGQAFEDSGRKHLRNDVLCWLESNSYDTDSRMRIAKENADRYSPCSVRGRILTLIERSADIKRGFSNIFSFS